MSSPASGPNHSCQELFHQMNTGPSMLHYQSLESQELGFPEENHEDSSSTDVVLLKSDQNFNHSIAWYYISCPPENECQNGHHSCNEESEECVDLAEGFHCVCGKGYQPSMNSQCIPICSQGNSFNQLLQNYICNTNLILSIFHAYI